MGSNNKKGQFTFRTAAVFFILSAIAEIIAILFLDSRVTLFGAVRGGLVAVVYDLIYAALFVALGVGLWRANSWGYPLIFATTIYYTLDTIQAVLSSEAAELDLKQQLVQLFSEHENIFQQAGIGKEIFLNVFFDTYHNMMLVLPYLFLACWWGFVLYTYQRRDYFKSP